jgi:hypothetical protein
MHRRFVPIVLLAALGAASCGSTVLRLEVGDCFDDPESFESVSSVDTVDCSEPHDNEVYHVESYTESSTYPGKTIIEEAAFTACLEAFEAFIGIPYSDSRFDIAALWPSSESWEEADDREIVCAVYDIDGIRLTGSVAGSRE